MVWVFMKINPNNKQWNDYGNYQKECSITQGDLENVKVKNGIFQNPAGTCFRLTIFTSKYIFLGWEILL